MFKRSPQTGVRNNWGRDYIHKLEERLMWSTPKNLLQISRVVIIYIYARFPCAAETESARYGPTFGGVSFQTFGVFWFRLSGSGSDLWIFAALFLVVSDPQIETIPPTFTHISPQFLRATFGLCLLVRYFFCLFRLLFVPFGSSAAVGGACLILNVCNYVF